MSSSVFVLGAGGYIGEGVALAFRRAGYRVFGLVRDEKKAVHLERLEVIAVRGKLEDYASYASIIAECAVVVDAVGFHAGSDAFLRNLIATTKSGARAAHGPSFKPVFLFTSGIMTYGDAAGDVTTCAQVDEHTVPKPFRDDLKERFEFEKRVLAVQELHASVIRPGFVFGGHGGHIADMFFGVDAKAPVLTLLGSPDKRWSWVHLDDLAAAYVAAAKLGARVAGELFNVATPEAPAYRELRTRMAHAAGWRGEVRFEPVPPSESRVLGWEATVIVNPAKARALLGWEARHAGLLAELDLYYLTWSLHRKANAN